MIPQLEAIVTLLDAGRDTEALTAAAVLVKSRGMFKAVRDQDPQKFFETFNRIFGILRMNAEARSTALADYREHVKNCLACQQPRRPHIRANCIEGASLKERSRVDVCQQLDALSREIRERVTGQSQPTTATEYIVVDMERTRYVVDPHVLTRQYQQATTYNDMNQAITAARRAASNHRRTMHVVVDSGLETEVVVATLEPKRGRRK